MDLNQVAIDVSDLARSAAFYERLGLMRIVWSPPRYARFECPSGSTTLSLEQAAAPIVKGAALYFEVDDLDRRAAEFRALGIEAEGPVDQSWLWRELWTADPDGRRICIFHAGQNRRFPPWRVDAAPTKA